MPRRLFGRSVPAFARAAQRGGQGAPAGRRARIDSRAEAISRQGRADQRRRAARAHREGAAADGRARDRRDRARARHEHELLRQRPLGPERAAVPARHPAEGRPGLRRRPGSRRRARARSPSSPTTCASGRRTRTGARRSRGILKDRGVATGKIGVEERVRFFIADGIAQAAPASKVVLATPVTAGCRMIKSPAEIALMQRANDITIEAYKAAFATLREGMTQFELRRNVSAAFDALGAPGGSAGAQLRQVLRLPARQHHAAAAQDGRRRPHRRRLQHRRVSVRHHADDGVRQADRSGRSTSGISRSRRRPRRSRPRRSARRASRWMPPRAR